jgi:hypothetical protein
MPGMVDVEIEVDSSEVTALLSRLNTALDPVAMGAWLGVKIGPYIRQRAAARFAGEGDDVVGAWAPLEESTWAFREKQHFPPRHPINKRTGELEDYILNGGEDIRVSTLTATLIMPGDPPGNKEFLDKVKTAQMGRDYPKTVKRPVMGMNENDLLFVLEALSLHIAGMP